MKTKPPRAGRWQARDTRDFRRFWLAAAVSNVGDGVRLAALPLLALELTADPRLIAGVTAAMFLPWVVIGPFAGALVDRHDRRRLILAGQAGRAVAVLTLAVSVSQGWATIAMVYIAAVAIGAGETLVDSAAQAAIPHLVADNRLERANGQLVVAESLFNDVIGVAIGGVLFAAAAGLPFYIDALSFAAGALIVAGIRRPLQGERATGRSLGGEVVEGARFLARHDVLRGLALSVAVTNFALNMGLGVLVVLIVREIGASHAAYGTVLAVGALGGVAGSLVAGRLAERFGPPRLLRVVHLPFVAGAIVAAVASRTWMVSIGFGLSSFALVVFQIPSRAIRQRVTPDALLGRVVAAFRILGLGGPVAGAPAGGLIASALGVRWTFAASALVMAVAWGVLLRALAPRTGRLR